MNLPSILKRVSKLTADNTPTILSALAITGTLTTAYLTGKATFKAAEIIADEAEKRLLYELEENRTFSTKDKIKLVWPQYIPAAGMAVTTVGCIVFANTINTKRLAAVAAAYSISEKRFTEYKDKVLEKMGMNKERAARDELAQERVNANPPSNNPTIIMGGGDVLFMDSMSGRYFMSDMETIRKAMNDINQRMMHEMYASLSEFYSEIGLANTKFSDEVGWTVENPLDLHFSTTLADNNRPCIVIDFHTSPSPIRGYSFH